MKIFVRTTGERSLEQFTDIEYTPLVDKEKTGRRGYFNQLKHLSTLEDDILILEDDIKLKKCFMTCLNDLVEATSNKYIINMSQPCNTIKLCEPKEFFWTRAVYYPKGSIKEFMKNYTDDMADSEPFWDRVQQKLMTKKYLGVPSIINVIDLNLASVTDHTPPNKVK